ncbi:MAG: dual specificity protein phosphatase family protein [Phycisphaerales bacterium]
MNPDPADDAPRPRKSIGRLFLTIGVIVAVIGGGIWLWEDVLEDRLIPKRFGVVVPGSIYRSGQLSPTLIRKTLARHEIDLVVHLGVHDPLNKAHVAEQAAVESLGIERRLFPLQGDGTGDIDNYAQAIAAIVEARDAGQRVLVHCAAGSYRTGGVIASYRMLLEGMPPDEAWAEMEQYSWNSDIPILPEYLNSHMAQLTEKLVQLGVIERVPEPLPVLASD